MTSLLRTACATVATTVALACIAAPASAHVEPEPDEVPANTATSIDLVVEHGCGTAPISKVVTRLPAAAVDVTAEAPDGWTVSIAAGVVTWDGAARPVRADLRLGLRLTARADAGTELTFPTIESCPDGQEVRWIEDIPPTDDESKHPVPRVTVVAGAPTPTTTATTAAPATPAAAPATTTPAATTVRPSVSTSAASSTAPSSAGVTVSPTAPATSAAGATATRDGGDKGSGGSTAVVIAVVVVAIGAIGALVLMRRRRSTDLPPAP